MRRNSMLQRSVESLTCIERKRVLTSLMLCGRESEKHGMKMFLIDRANTVVYSLWEIKIGTTV